MNISLPLPGSDVPSVDEQSKNCAIGVTTLLAGAGSAIRTVSKLNLVVICCRQMPPPDCNWSLPQDQDKMDDYYRQSSSLAIPSNPSHPCLVPQDTLRLLAAAVPGLQHLTLRTLYRNVDLSVFGSHCPKLARLDLKSNASILRGIELALPHLTHLRLCNCYTFDACGTPRGMREHIETACQLVRACTKLVSLELDSEKKLDTLDCPRETWELLPASLKEWHCNLDFPHMLEAASFMGRLRALSVGKLPSNKVQALLKLAPLLKQLSVAEESTRTNVELMWGQDTTASDLCNLKARLLNGFSLDCLEVGMSGPSEAVRDILTWHSPLEHTRVCFINLPASMHSLDCLAQLARVCPKITELYIRDASDWEEAPWMDKSIITPVLGCKLLDELEIDVSVAFTDADLFDLCMGLPALRALFCRKSEGVDFDNVMVLLGAEGRDVGIQSPNCRIYSPGRR